MPVPEPDHRRARGAAPARRRRRQLADRAGRVVVGHRLRQPGAQHLVAVQRRAVHERARSSPPRCSTVRTPKKLRSRTITAVPPAARPASRRRQRGEAERRAQRLPRSAKQQADRDAGRSDQRRCTLVAELASARGSSAIANATGHASSRRRRRPPAASTAARDPGHSAAASTSASGYSHQRVEDQRGDQRGERAAEDAAERLHEVEGRQAPRRRPVLGEPPWQTIATTKNARAGAAPMISHSGWRLERPSRTSRAAARRGSSQTDAA